MSNLFTLYVTFDLDFANYFEENWQLIDEFSILKRYMSLILEKNIRITWFIRMDRKVEVDFGSPDHLISQFIKDFREFIKYNHTIGWHPHIYKFIQNKWVQNTDEEEVLEELDYLLPFAKKYNLKIVRMGWGYMTNKVMKFLNDNGFIVDSTAIPRPKYRWEVTIKDWSITPNMFYHPSLTDYRIPGDNNHNSYKILEVPISTMPIRAPYDTDTVIRYCNLSYYNKYIQKPLQEWIQKHNHLVTITHPYELDHRFYSGNQLISFNFSEFLRNLELVKELVEKAGKVFQMSTLEEISNG